MNLIIEPTIEKGKVQEPLSQYYPDERCRERLAQIREECSVAQIIRNKSYTEFNDRALTHYIDDCQRAFNSYVPPGSPNPSESWKANTVRPATRNKVISIAAHVTGTMMYPNVVAQNDQDEEDRTAGATMKDLMEFSWEQSDYERTFIHAVIGALVNPVSIIYDGYCETKRCVKEIQEDGTWKEKKIIDEQYSGFINPIVPVDEFFIGDIYESNIQKQPFLIWRRVIDYNNAKLKYGDNENFKKYVRPGLRIFYDPGTRQFYEQQDDSLQGRLVEEMVYYNRYADLELHLVNGVLMDDPDQPNCRIDKNYPFIKFGYELFDEGRFFYYKSLVDKMKDDQRLLDTLYNMILDGTFMQIMPSLAIYGDEEAGSDVFVPGSSHVFGADTKVQPISTGANLNAGFNAIAKVESSISESSNDNLQSGLESSGNPTATEISRQEQNARVVLGLFGKMVKFAVEDFGKLRIPTILQYMTVGELMDETGDGARLKFRTILRPNKIIDGKKKSRKIEFDMNLPEKDTKAHKKLEYEMMKMEDENNMEIIKVNPELFRRMKYLVKVEADMLVQNSEAVNKLLNLEAYDRMKGDEYIDQLAIRRDFLFEAYKPGESDKYLKKAEESGGMPMGVGEQGGAEASPKQNSLPNQRSAKQVLRNKVKQDIPVSQQVL